jgi:hypothetical protein
MRNNSGWTFGVKELEKGELWNGYVRNVVDGDTVDVRFNIYGIQRVRLVGINTPEIGEDGYEEAKAFLNETCMMCEFNSVPFPKLVYLFQNCPWFISRLAHSPLHCYSREYL